MEMYLDSVEITNNSYGDPWGWEIRERTTGEVVGSITKSGSKYRAFDHGSRRSATGVDQLQAALNLYHKLGLSVSVSVAPGLTRTGIAPKDLRIERDPNKPLDLNGPSKEPLPRSEDEPFDFNAL